MVRIGVVGKHASSGHCKRRALNNVVAIAVRHRRMVSWQYYNIVTRMTMSVRRNGDGIFRYHVAR